MDDCRSEPPFPLYEGAVCIYPYFRVVVRSPWNKPRWQGWGGGVLVGLPKEMGGATSPRGEGGGVGTILPVRGESSWSHDREG